MQYCEKVYTGPALPPDDRVLYQIANGLNYIHSKKFVHLNIKPENILISLANPTIQMKLSDFGLIKQRKPESLMDDTVYESIAGSHYWMAPEMLVRDRSFFKYGTYQSDIFSAGCVFFFFLTRGSNPFGYPFIIIKNILDDNPVLFSQGQGKYFPLTTDIIRIKVCKT